MQVGKAHPGAYPISASIYVGLLESKLRKIERDIKKMDIDIKNINDKLKKILEGYNIES